MLQCITVMASVATPGVGLGIAAPASAAAWLPDVAFAPSSREFPNFCAASSAGTVLAGAAVFSKVDVLRIASSTGLLTDSAVVGAGVGGGVGGAGGKVGCGEAGADVAGLAGFTGLFSASFSTPQRSVSALGSAVTTPALTG